jgi:hypothetical protein
MIMRRHLLPVAIAISFGILTLLGLLLSLSNLTTPFLSWATFLAAVALLLGVVNLFSVHISRLIFKRNLYSGVLAISMLVTFGLAVTDSMGITDGGLDFVFTWVQAPLEAALASLLAFFLLFTGVRLLKERRTIWSVLFLVTAVILLLLAASSALLPPSIQSTLTSIEELIQGLFVLSAVRGVLIGVALGVVMLSLRVLIGVERPYNK